jgi:hypothetical protein
MSHRKKNALCREKGGAENVYVSLCFVKHHAMKAWGQWSVDPHFLIFSARCRWVVSSIPRPPWPREVAGTHWTAGGWAQTRYGSCGEKIFFPTAIVPSESSPGLSNLVSIAAEISSATVEEYEAHFSEILSVYLKRVPSLFLTRNGVSCTLPNYHVVRKYGDVEVNVYECRRAWFWDSKQSLWCCVCSRFVRFHPQNSISVGCTTNLEVPAQFIALWFYVFGCGCKVVK